MCLGAVASAADLSETLGLDISSTTIKNNPSGYTTMANYQIIDPGNELGVFSCNFDQSYYFITVQAVLATVTSSNGYTLSVTDAEKKEITGTTVVTERCYLKDVKSGSEDIYMPIVASKLLRYESEIAIQPGGDTFTGTGTALVAETGIGDRGFDNSTQVFTMDGSAAVSGLPRIQRGLETAPKTVVTYDMSVFVSENAQAAICRDGGSVLMTVAADGTVTYDYNGTMTTWSEKAEADKWNRIAVVCDRLRNHADIYVNGTQLTNSGITWTASDNVLNSFRMGVANGSGAGKVAYDDFRLSRGYYNNAADSVTVSGETADISISKENGEIRYNDAAITTADELKTALVEICNAGDVKVYADNTKSAYAETLTEASVAVLISPGGCGYEEYALIQGASPMQKLALTVSDKYERNFKHLGSASEVTNCYVKKLDNAIAVFSSSTQNEYTAYGYKVVQCLTSAAGYELSVVDSSKTYVKSIYEYDAVNHTTSRGTRKIDEVTAGDFLKGTKEGFADVYVPIVNKIEIYEIDDLSKAGNYWQSVPKSNTGGIAGKDTSDTAETSTATSATTALAKKQLENSTVNTQYTFAPYFSGGIYTYAVNVYADGDTTARIIVNNGQWVDAFLWKPDGTYSYNVDKKDNVVSANTEGGSLERGRWHRVAVTLDIDRGRLHFWVDGKLCTNFSSYTKSISRIDLAIETGSANGRVAYDDLKIYNGFYDAEEDIASVKNGSICIAVEENNLYYNSEITDLDKLKSETTSATNAQNVKIYKNAALTAEAQNLSEAAVALVVSESGNGFCYYDIAENNNTLAISKTENAVTAHAIYSVPVGTQILIAEYNGELLSSCTLAVKESADDESETAMLYDAAKTYKAFLRTPSNAPLSDVKILEQ